MPIKCILSIQSHSTTTKCNNKYCLSSLHFRSLVDTQASPQRTALVGVPLASMGLLLAQRLWELYRQPLITKWHAIFQHLCKLAPEHFRSEEQKMKNIVSLALYKNMLTQTSMKSIFPWHSKFVLARPALSQPLAFISTLLKFSRFIPELKVQQPESSGGKQYIHVYPYICFLTILIPYLFLQVKKPTQD